MTSTVYLNGEWLPADQAAVSVFDRGFLFGDAVYEVIIAYNRQLFRLEQHLARLTRSLSETGIQNPFGIHEWRFLIERLIELNEGDNQSVYLQVSRGVSQPRRHNYPLNLTPTVFLSSDPLLLKSQRTSQIKACSAVTLEDIRWSRGDIKSTSLLGSVLLKKQVFESGADEGILIRDGWVAEGTASNVFLVKESKIITPKISDWILTGVTRDFIFELCFRYGLVIEERDVSLPELVDADEIWLTSTTAEIRPVTELNACPVGTGNIGPLWKKMAAYYDRHKAELFSCGS